MASVFTNSGKEILIDEEDLAWATQFTWYVTDTGYAYRSVRVAGKSKNIRMHRELLSATKGVDVDHINGNRVDNRRTNLRLCSRSNNLKNKTKRRCDNRSGITGVFQHKQTGKWAVQIQVDGKPRHVGLFATLDEAKVARKDIEAKLYGEFAPKANR